MIDNHLHFFICLSNGTFPLQKGTFHQENLVVFLKVKDISSTLLLRTLEEAASVPVVYATAYYALVVRGGMKKGESVLIHSGSGGVGQAAIAIALSMGCRVFATVGEYRGPKVTERNRLLL